MILKSCFLLLVIGCAMLARADEAVSPPTGEPVTPADMKRLARRIEPDLAGKPDRLSQYVDFFPAASSATTADCSHSTFPPKRTTAAGSNCVDTWSSRRPAPRSRSF